MARHVTDGHRTFFSGGSGDRGTIEVTAGTVSVGW